MRSLPRRFRSPQAAVRWHVVAPVHPRGVALRAAWRHLGELVRLDPDQGGVRWTFRSAPAATLHAKIVESTTGRRPRIRATLERAR